MSQTSRRDVGRDHEVPLLGEELLVDGSWGSESHFSLELWPLVVCPYSSGWWHTQSHVDSTN